MLIWVKRPGVPWQSPESRPYSGDLLISNELGPVVPLEPTARSRYSRIMEALVRRVAVVGGDGFEPPLTDSPRLIV
jgi:hypothetical protein